MHRSAIISVVSLLPISGTAFAEPEQGEVEVVGRYHAMSVDCNRLWR